MPIVALPEPERMEDRDRMFPKDNRVILDFEVIPIQFDGLTDLPA